MTYKKEYNIAKMAFAAKYMEQVSLKVRKGGKELLRSEAQKRNTTINRLICDAVNQYCGYEVISTRRPPNDDE